MDASLYKDYILTLLFVKYVSDKAAADPDALVVVPEGGSFADIAALKNKKDIGEGIDVAIGVLAKANDLGGIIDVASFNDDDKLGKGKEMVDRLSKLVAIFEGLDFRGSRAAGDDLLGDAYEYLMQHFATESGKSKGQFYTPAEVSRVLAKVVGIGAGTRQDQSVYDPTCGSGSLLLKAADEAPNGLTVYGQEKDVATWALARMNMILHGYETAELIRDDTITSPGFIENGALKRHDFVVANPPFSTKSWSSGINPAKDEYGRFEFGVPPAKNGDYAFLLHALKSLTSTGKAAIILPHGVLFRGNAEAVIRKNLLRRGLVKGVIGLPANLFFGTGIPACIILLDKEDAQERTGVFIVDASKGFTKDGPKNRLRSQDIHKVVDVFTKQTEIERYSRMVPLAEIADPRNDYNLNIPRYIDSSEPEDTQDLPAHLHGGIPDRDLEALGRYWDAFPSLRNSLLSPNRPGYSSLAVEPRAVQQLVRDSDQFKQFADDVRGEAGRWFAEHRPVLQGLDAETLPGDLIAAIGNDLLARFKNTPLLDKYDVYEQLMTYWHGVMHDDVLLVMNGGWVAAAQPRRIVEDKERRLSETPDLTTSSSGRGATKYKTDLIPSNLIVARFFASEQAEVDDLGAAAEEANRTIADYASEHVVEDGLLAEAVNDGKISKTTAAARLKDARREQSDPAEIQALQHLAQLYAVETAAKKAFKDAQAALDLATFRKYSDLTESEIKQLVLDDKWRTTISARIVDEVGALTLALAARLKQLGQRYEQTTGDLDDELSRLGSRVARHLADMGVSQGAMQQPSTGKTRAPSFAKPWSVSRLGELGVFLKGRGIRRDDVRQTGVPCIRYGEIYTTFGDYTTSTVSFVDRAVADEALPICTGDLLFAGSGETREEIGKCVAFMGTGPAVAGGDLVVLRGTAFNPVYLASLINTPAIAAEKAKRGQGDAVVHISSKALSDIEVSLPSREEQDAVATVLSDMNDEIEILRKLLTNSQAVRQGAMQELLTGRTRLPVEKEVP